MSVNTRDSAIANKNAHDKHVAGISVIMLNYLLTYLSGKHCSMCATSTSFCAEALLASNPLTFQGCSRSTILVPIERANVISY